MMIFQVPGQPLINRLSIFAQTNLGHFFTRQRAKASIRKEAIHSISIFHVSDHIGC
jgi:hypothetical protein